MPTAFWGQCCTCFETWDDVFRVVLYGYLRVPTASLTVSFQAYSVHVWGFVGVLCFCSLCRVFIVVVHIPPPSDPAARCPWKTHGEFHDQAGLPTRVGGISPVAQWCSPSLSSLYSSTIYSIFGPLLLQCLF